MKDIRISGQDTCEEVDVDTESYVSIDTPGYMTGLIWAGDACSPNQRILLPHFLVIIAENMTFTFQCEQMFK